MSADARAALEHLWHTAGGDPAALARVTLTGADPLLPTDFKIGAAASAAVAATSLAAAELWGLRTGRAQDVATSRTPSRRRACPPGWCARARSGARTRRGGPSQRCPCSRS